MEMPHSESPLDENDLLDILLFDLLIDDPHISEQQDDDMDNAALAVLAGAQYARQLRIARRNPRRLYLVRNQLLPNPKQDTPWQQLYASHNHRAYITTMGVDVATFQYILESGFEQRWDETTILRPDVRRTGRPRLGGRSLDAAGVLGLILHWLNSTMREVSLQQIFALIPTTVNRYIHAGLPLLLKVLESMPEAMIRWPRGDEFYQYTNQIVDRHGPILEGAFGSVDGLNLPVQVSSDDEIENASYNGWLHSHFVSSVLAYAPSGRNFESPF